MNCPHCGGDCPNLDLDETCEAYEAELDAMYASINDDFDYDTDREDYFLYDDDDEDEDDYYWEDEWEDLDQYDNDELNFYDEH